MLPVIILSFTTLACTGSVLWLFDGTVPRGYTGQHWSTLGPVISNLTRLILPQWAPDQSQQGFIVTLAVGQPRPGMLDDAPREVSQQATKGRG